MKIVDVVCSVGLSSYFHMDFAAIRAGARPDGFIYNGKPLTTGFHSIVQPAHIISILLLLEDGQIAHGDCADVAFAGAAGRDPPLAAHQSLALIEGGIGDRLRGRDVSLFRSLAGEFDTLEHAGVRLHSAIRYGISQALLHATALTRRLTVAEVVADEYETRIAGRPIAITASCELGDLRQLDRMILKRLELLPHSFFTDIETEVGRSGEIFAKHVAKVSRRIQKIGASDYRPRLHFDLCGTLGEVFDLDIERLATFLGTLLKKAAPYDLLIEAPIVADGYEKHIDLFCRLRDRLRSSGIPIKIVADEWCNTLEDVERFAGAGAADVIQIKMPDLGGVDNAIEAVLCCKKYGIGACLGGTANETDQSSRISAQIALGCQPDFMLSKPGLGGDEGLMIERNEMSRAIALIAHRRRFHAPI